jgi:hypothetical protein
MKIERLCQGYKEYTDKLISDNRIEVERANSLGDHYFYTVQTARSRIGNARLNDLKILAVEFERRKEYISWLHSFLLEKLPLSQREPVYLDDRHRLYLQPKSKNGDSILWMFDNIKDIPLDWTWKIGKYKRTARLNI